MDNFTDPHTGVFYNKLGITDAQELEQATKDASLRRLQELAAGYGPQGDTFDAQRLRAVHHHLFQDTFEWAGQTRREAGFQGVKAADLPGMERPMHFAPFERIDERLNAVGEQLKQENNLKGLPTPEAFAERAAYYFDHYNHVHAFREGNGRTLQATFAEIAYQAGYQVDFNQEHEKLNPARDQGIVGLHGAGHKDRDLQALRELFARNTTPLPGPDAEAARHPGQARPLTDGPTPAVRHIEQLRELVAAAPAMQQLVAGVDYRRNQRADALLSQVLDIDRNPQAGVAQHGAGLQQLLQEVKGDKRFQDPVSQHEAARFGAALTVLSPEQTKTVLSTPALPSSNPPTALTATFVQAAKQLVDGLEEQGYPGPADSLLRAAKAVEKSAYLGGANLQAVAEALTRAEKIPALADDAATLRGAGRSMQEVQRTVAPPMPGREDEGPER
ncbi:Fic/DOC family protein [Hymenobacter psychrotolerans]|uniref:protein adenylyltransferase n=1 Tax=Hymenobacter psychrotolerans DSM 18569 TaxID=1121959 RepID=A0A1M7G2W3_9BACT|nr:Fic family protein [Hymenobacter psychrotolerans]SHM10505.1 Fido, protein-threonine AMPylation domain-containing protein [Hymenobacter psychrotolerans DSM 18569]